MYACSEKNWNVAGPDMSNVTSRNILELRKDNGKHGCYVARDKFPYRSKLRVQRNAIFEKLLLRALGYFPRQHWESDFTWNLGACTRTEAVYGRRFYWKTEIRSRVGASAEINCARLTEEPIDGDSSAKEFFLWNLALAGNKRNVCTWQRARLLLNRTLLVKRPSRTPRSISLYFVCKRASWRWTGIIERWNMVNLRDATVIQDIRPLMQNISTWSME